MFTIKGIKYFINLKHNQWFDWLKKKRVNLMVKHTLSNQNMVERQEPNRSQNVLEKELGQNTPGYLKQVLGGAFTQDQNNFLLSEGHC